MSKIEKQNKFRPHRDGKKSAPEGRNRTAMAAMRRGLDRLSAREMNEELRRMA